VDLEGTTTPTGLTSAYSQTAQQATSGGATVISSSDYAKTDLPSASLHANAATNALGGWGGSAISELWDSLTFNIPGATTSTITNVALTFTVDGTFSPPNNGSEVYAKLDLGSGGFGNNEFFWGVNTGFLGSGAQVYAPSPQGNVTWNVMSYSTSGAVVQGVIALQGASPTLGLVATLALFANNAATLDFSNTGALSLTLPPGVTFTSASGAFLTASNTQPFASFRAKLDAAATSIGSFDLNSTFTLGSTSAPVDPVTQPVSLEVGPYHLTIPANSFHKLLQGRKAGSWVYSGTVNGTSLDVQIVPLGGLAYQFKASGTPVDLATLTEPATVSITVGNNNGTTQVFF
jgi:hypothetical protein